ncbi:MAG: SAM-dependent methyltransferase, partial [Planctomycetota bacterium]
IIGVDINPSKRGKFVSGVGTPIVGPEDLRELSPSLVVLMNPIYRDEVAAMLRPIAPEAELLTA